MTETWWLTTVAIAIFATSNIQFISQSARWVAHRRRTASQNQLRQSVLAHASQLARLSSQLGTSTSSPKALNWRILEVADVVQESDDCRSFYLIDPYGQELPDFLPGQYAMIRPAVAGAYQVTRCYSLSSAPDSRYWRITVKRQESDENNPNENTNRALSGGLSQWLHETIGRGDCLFVGGPSGHFFLPRESTNDLVLIAAGVGITPMASMLRWSLEQTPNRSVTLLNQVKDDQHWPLGRTLHSWQSNFASMQAHTFFSRMEPEAIEKLSEEFPGTFHAGKLDPQSLAPFIKPDTDYYMCGPDSWMESMRQQLQQLGIDAAYIHWESFGGVASIKSESTSEHSYKVRFDLSDVEVEWNDPEQSLWELAKANQIELASGCLSGVCGCCRVKLLEGDVQYDRQISIELAGGECLTCVARPKANLVLNA